MEVADKKNIDISKALHWCRNNTNLIILLVMVLIGALTSEAFFTWSNLMNLFRRVAINGIMAIGFTITLLIGGFDLSIGATLSMGAVFAIGISNTLSDGGLDPNASYMIGMCVALLAGTLMGLFNGLMMKITRGGSGEAFLITMATSFIGTAIALTYCKGLDLYARNTPAWYRNIGMGEIAGFPTAALIWIILLIIFQVIIKKTQLGRKMLLCGANRSSAFLAGVDIGKLKLFGFAIAGLFAAFAGIMLTARTTAGGPNSGAGGDFDATIASIIGGNSLIGGHGGMTQVFIGTLIYGLITNILNLLGVESAVQYIFKGAILLLAICLDHIKER